MKKEELEYRLRELITKIDCRLAADVLLEAAKSQYLRYASEVAEAKYSQGRTDKARHHLGSYE